VLLLITLVLPICIKVVMTNPAYAAEAAQITSIIDMQPVRGADPEVLAAELRTPAAASVMLPAGLLGLFAAALLGAFISTNDTYLHSWGSIFIQDVVLPLRGKPLSAKAHLWLLRGSIFGVAIFAFIFSMLYTPNQYVAMFLALTGAIFVGGAGSAIIGGLYWRRGTTAGAWTAMILGMSLAIFGVVVKQVSVESLEGSGVLLEAMRYVRYEITGQVLMFASIALSVTSYVVVSLVQWGEPFELDRLLHRGAYRRDEDQLETLPAQTWMQRLGFDRNMTGWDKFVTAVTIAWPLFFTLVFLVGLIAYFTMGESPLSSEEWATGWRIWLWVALATATVVTVWFTLGGIRDIVRMFRRLALVRTDEADDGFVIDGENRDDIE
jgi:SSS family solute:Na+ symporter